MAKQLYEPPSRYDENAKLLEIDDELVDYIQDSIADSKVYLRSNRAWKVADVCMAVLFGDEINPNISGTSNLSINKLRRQARELVAQQSNIRPRWGFRTPIEKLKESAEIKNKVLNHWFSNNFIDRGIRKSLQWAVGAGTGYGFLWPEKSQLTGKIEIIYRDLSHKQVLVDSIPSDGDLQKTYCLTVHLEMPKTEADEKFPHHKDLLVPDRYIPGWVARNFQKVKRMIKSALDIGSKRRQTKETLKSFGTCDVFYSWIKDLTYNSTGKTIEMGKSYYSYSVPSYLDEEGNINKIKTGAKIRNLETGKLEDEFRDVELEDCKLYPNRRLVISTNSGIIYDGPPMWGGDLIPVVQFKLDDIPNEFLGLPAFLDAKKLNDSVNTIVRSVEDRIDLRLNPPMAIDKRVPITIARMFNPRRKQKQPFHYDMNVLVKAFVPLLDSNFYKIEAVELEFMKYLQEMQDYLSGTNDFSWAQRLNQMPAQDTQEALISKMGMIATDQSRNVEYSLLQMGLIWGQFFPQVYTTKRALEILGKDGISLETFDYDPQSFVPYEDSNDERDFHTRFKKYCQQFSFYAAPNSLQERSSMTRKLALLQVQNAKVKISGRKIYDAFVEDDDYMAQVAEFRKEQSEDIKMAAELNAELEKAKQNASNPVAQALKEQGLLGENSENGKVGRPPTNNAPARMETKTNPDGTSRPITATN